MGFDRIAASWARRANHSLNTPTGSYRQSWAKGYASDRTPDRLGQVSFSLLLKVTMGVDLLPDFLLQNFEVHALKFTNGSTLALPVPLR